MPGTLSPVAAGARLPPASRGEARALFYLQQQRALQQGVALRSPPPEPLTCCGRGCNGCVWEGYYQAAAYWCEEARLTLAP